MGADQPYAIGSQGEMVQKLRSLRGSFKRDMILWFGLCAFLQIYSCGTALAERQLSPHYVRSTLAILTFFTIFFLIAEGIRYPLWWAARTNWNRIPADNLP